MKKLLNKKGFTLIELIVVIAILAILALILVPSILRYIDEATDSRDLANARALYSEISIAVALEQGQITIANEVSVPSGCSVLVGGTAATTVDTNTEFVVKCGGQTFNGAVAATTNP